MPRVTANGISLEYDSIGSGEPVVFIHGVLIAWAFGPVAQDLSLDAYQRVLYARRGYAGSEHPAGPTAIGEQAADCAALLAALGIEGAHIVGHSYGGAIALQLALSAPHRVRTLSLLEPALLVGDSAAGYSASLAGTVQRAAEAGPEVAVHEFLEMRSPGYRARLDRLIPGAWEQVVRDASTALEHELPSLLQWTFGEEQARRIHIPTHLLLGDRSRELSSRFQETFDRLRQWLPHVSGEVIPGATHLMQTDAPDGVASALDAFFAKHPLH